MPTDQPECFRTGRRTRTHRGYIQRLVQLLAFIANFAKQPAPASAVVERERPALSLGPPPDELIFSAAVRPRRAGGAAPNRSGDWRSLPRCCSGDYILPRSFTPSHGRIPRRSWPQGKPLELGGPSIARYERDHRFISRRPILAPQLIDRAFDQVAAHAAILGNEVGELPTRAAHRYLRKRLRRPAWQKTQPRPRYRRRRPSPSSG